MGDQGGVERGGESRARVKRYVKRGVAVGAARRVVGEIGGEGYGTMLGRN